MPQLQIIEDPYAVSTGAAVNDLAGGLMGPSPTQLGNYQVLAAKMREADAQQRKIALEMKNAEADRRKMQDMEDAAGRKWGYATPAPVGANGQPPTPEQMEQYYRDQNYNDQMSRGMVRAGKGAEDVASSMEKFRQNFNASYPPAGAPSPMAPPPGIAGNPVAEKKYFEEQAKNKADMMSADEKSRLAASQILPQILQSRESFHKAAQAGGVGKIIGSDFGRMNTAMGFGETNANRAAAQDEYEKAAAFWQSRQISANNQGLGAMSNYEQQLARQPFAKLNDVNEEVGLGAIDRQIAYNLQTLGVPGSIAPQVVAAITSGQVPGQHVDMLLRDLRAGDMSVLQEFMEKYGAMR